MRRHLWSFVWFFIGSTVLFGAIRAGGFPAMLAAGAAALVADRLQALWSALLDSLNPRTDAEAKYLKRVGRDIIERHRQAQVQVAVQAAKPSPTEGA